LRLHYRKPEIFIIAYFFYLAALTFLLRDRPRADVRVLGIAVLIAAAMTGLAWAEDQIHRDSIRVLRDWAILASVLACYRTLDLFSPVTYQVNLEAAWQHWDHILLSSWHIRAAIEYCGAGVPAYLETCYLLTSGAGCYGLIILYTYRKRERFDRFLLIYVMGTLLSYALVPILRLQPPRVAFPGADVPEIATAMRRLNLVVLSGAGIHSGVFPSAHVSSTFAAAWGLFTALPERKRYGWIFFIYAISVAVATIYGRYHYAVDAVAGVAVSIIAAVAAKRWLGVKNYSIATERPAARSTR
jgi:membrane-associated phospholipid phosphatase